MFLHAVGFGIVTAAVMALAAVGFTVQFGVTNILNLAYGDVMTASAFVAYVSYSAGQIAAQTPRFPTAIWSGAADPATWRGAFSRILGGLA
jgi:branched-subunit amino acid ABC-type transport system permease component